MEFISIPKTPSGRWSVWLGALFLGVILASVTLVKVLKVLSFGDRWWDITVPVALLASILALSFGVVAIKKNGETSILIYASVTVGLLTILFIPLHSLFIGD